MTRPSTSLSPHWIAAELVPRPLGCDVFGSAKTADFEMADDVLGFDLVSAGLRTRRLPPALRQDTVPLSLAPTIPSPSLFESPRPPLGLARDKTMTSTRFDKTEEVSSLVSIAPWGRGLRKRLPMGQDTGPSATAPPGVAPAKTLLWMAAEPAGGGIAVLAMTSMRCAKTAPVSALAVGAHRRRRFPAFAGHRGYAEAVGPAMTPTVPTGAAVSAVDGRDSLAMAIGPRQAGAVQIRQDSRPRGGHDGSAGDEEKMQTRRAVAAGQDRRRRRFLSTLGRRGIRVR